MTIDSSPAVALEPIAYLHTLHMDGDCNFEEVTRTATSPFDASRPVTTTPLYAAPRTPAETASGNDAAAIALWHRFAPSHHMGWEAESEKAIYRDAAEQIISMSTPAETGEVERLKADLKDEINFDLNTRINKVPESVVDQVVDLLAERGLLALTALPPSSGWEAGANVLEVLQDVEDALIETDPKSETRLGRLLPITQDCIRRASASLVSNTEAVVALQKIASLNDPGCGYLMRKMAQQALDTIREYPSALGGQRWRLIRDGGDGPEPNP